MKPFIEGADRHQVTLSVTPEDLCTQTGWALPQDLALVALTGSIQAEMSGHRCGESFAGLSTETHQQLVKAHPDLYYAMDEKPRLAVADGRIALGSVNRCAGFGTSVRPDFNRMTEVDAKSVVRDRPQRRSVRVRIPGVSSCLIPSRRVEVGLHPVAQTGLDLFLKST